MMEVEQNELMSSGDISAFTADVDLGVVYWMDSASRKMWSGKLTDTNHSLVGNCSFS